MSEHPIYELSDGLVDAYADHSPMLATAVGLGGYDDRWDDLSPEGSDAFAAMLRERLAAIAHLPPATTSWEQLAVRAAAERISDDLERIDSGDHLRDVSHSSSPVQHIRGTFDHMDKATADGWADIATRLETVAPALSGYRAALDAGVDQGLVVAQRQVDAAAAQCDTAAGEHSPFHQLAADLARSPVDHSRLSARIDHGIAAACRAYADLATYLRDTYRPNTVDVDGVGEDRYLRSAREHLGTTIDPHETYEWGWTEVERIRRRMREVGHLIVPGGGLADIVAVLKTDPQRCAPDRDAFVGFISARLAEALDELAGVHFEVPEPIRTVTVNLAPPGGPLGAYYVGPSEDFARPGSVWWSLEGDGPFPLYDEVSTAYHEGFPGHHLQVGVQMCSAAHLSRFQRMIVWYPGIGEGWALYAEHLMHELGYLEEPDYVFGLLAAQMLRACRVVIDIGIHLGLRTPHGQPFHPGEVWTFDIARDMLERYATLNPSYAESEVTRYCGWPGQAIAYKVGERAIFEIRARLEQRPGFDLGRFHSDLLGIGPVGIDLAREMLIAP